MRVRVNAQERREYLQQLKRVPCADCNQTFPPVCMDFDHRPGAIKRFNLSASAATHGLRSIKAEVAKCDVVCANCHRLRSAKALGWAGSE